MAQCCPVQGAAHQHVWASEHEVSQKVPFPGSLLQRWGAGTRWHSETPVLSTASWAAPAPAPSPLPEHAGHQFSAKRSSVLGPWGPASGGDPSNGRLHSSWVSKSWLFLKTFHQNVIYLTHDGGQPTNPDPSCSRLSRAPGTSLGNGQRSPRRRPPTWGPAQSPRQKRAGGCRGQTGSPGRATSAPPAWTAGTVPEQASHKRPASPHVHREPRRAGTRPCPLLTPQCPMGSPSATVERRRQRPSGLPDPHSREGGDSSQRPFQPGTGALLAGPLAPALGARMPPFLLSFMGSCQA